MSRVASKADSRATPRQKSLLHLIGATTGLLAIFISAGGHWAVLQSIAYTRMLVEFAQQDSLGTAVRKTFDDRYACALCPKIRDGCNQERKAPQIVKGDRMPEFLVESDAPILFRLTIVADVAFVSSEYVHFSTAPPKPPPRLV